MLVGIGNRCTESHHFIQTTLTLPTIDGHTTTLTAEFHIIPKLDAGILIGCDALWKNNITIDIPSQIMILQHKYCVKVKTYIPQAIKSQKKWAIYAVTSYTIPAGHGSYIPI